MSNNNVYLRSKKVKRIGGKDIVLFSHAYNHEVSVLAKEKHYGSESHYDRVVNQRENKAMKYCETQKDIGYMVLCDNWTSIGLHYDLSKPCLNPVYIIEPHDYYIREGTQLPPIAGFVSRTGYQYSFLAFEDACEPWKQHYPEQIKRNSSSNTKALVL